MRVAERTCPGNPRSDLRILVHAPANAAWNMAVDEALLLAATTPTLRFYGWAPHAVSLGYFQAHRDFADVARTTPIVRRLTGGGAIHHGDELTFSLALATALLPGTVGDGYRGLHDSIVRALHGIGVTSHRIDTGSAPSARPSDRWCFAEPGCFDIVTERGKLLGSAQRRLGPPHDRVLHHGSLVLRQPSLTPAVAAVADSRNPPSAATLTAALGAELAAFLGLAAVMGELTAAEHQLAERLVVERYAAARWNQRR